MQDDKKLQSFLQCSIEHVIHNNKNVWRTFSKPTFNSVKEVNKFMPAKKKKAHKKKAAPKKHKKAKKAAPKKHKASKKRKAHKKK